MEPNKPKICVLIKQVPDSETRIAVRPDGSGLSEEGVKWILNPYDEYAVEEALKLREKLKEAEVVIVTLGPARSKDAIRAALAMGADRGVRIANEGLELDLFCAAYAISKVVAREKFDIIFAGKKACDDDLSAMPQFVAELCEMRFAGAVERFETTSDGRTAIVEMSCGGGMKEVVEIDLPCVVACEKGLNVPRYPSLPNIMRSKSKQIAEYNALDLLDGESPRVSICGWATPPERAAGQKVVLEPDAAAEAIVRFLKDEAKVI